MGAFIDLGHSDLDRPIYRFSTFARLIEHFPRNGVREQFP